MTGCRVSKLLFMCSCLQVLHLYGLSTASFTVRTNQALPSSAFSKLDPFYTLVTPLPVQILFMPNSPPKSERILQVWSWRCTILIVELERHFATVQGSHSHSYSPTAMNDIILTSLRELGGLSATFGPILVVFLAESRASLEVRT